MKIIVGLGNPGKKYELTRHNVGWKALEYIISNFKPARTVGHGGFQISKSENKFNSEIAEDTTGDVKIIFVKPQTFMNLSGSAVSEIINYYKINTQNDLLVIHDEIDLPLGSIKFTKSSSAAGHNGVKNIIENLGTQNFCRIRIGIESRSSREQIPTDAFVLQNFSEEDLKKLSNDVFPKTQTEIEKFLSL
ncbi:MAG: aminoacyl-tRNA hydrolase [Candidatus Doudnabacteria bacterium]|nr:aminoacyl-tRNA hydrolase [Candidatus Doudnabacteria bacterium]